MIYLPHRRKAFRGGGGTPDTIASADLVFWLEAGSDCEEASGDPCENGDAIQYWRDKSIQTNDASQATSGDRPTYTADGGTDWNNGPVVNFAGASTQWMQFTDCLSSLTSGEVMVILKLANDPPTSGQGGLWYMTGITSGSGRISHYPYTDGTVYENWGRSTRISFSPSVDLSTAPRIYNISSESSSWVARIDGTQEYSIGSGGGSWGAVNQILGAADNKTFVMDGEMAAIAVWDDVLSTADRSTMYDYFDALRA